MVNFERRSSANAGGQRFAQARPNNSCKPAIYILSGKRRSSSYDPACKLLTPPIRHLRAVRGGSVHNRMGRRAIQEGWDGSPLIGQSRFGSKKIFWAHSGSEGCTAFEEASPGCNGWRGVSGECYVRRSDLGVACGVFYLEDRHSVGRIHRADLHCFLD
jgi:hypothetical protein